MKFSMKKMCTYFDNSRYKRIEETCPRNKFSLLIWRIAVNEEKWIVPEVALSISRLFLRVDPLPFKTLNVDM